MSMRNSKPRSLRNSGLTGSRRGSAQRRIRQSPASSPERHGTRVPSALPPARHRSAVVPRQHGGSHCWVRLSCSVPNAADRTRPSTPGTDLVWPTLRKPVPSTQCATRPAWPVMPISGLCRYRTRKSAGHGGVHTDESRHNHKPSMRAGRRSRAQQALPVGIQDTTPASLARRGRGQRCR